MRIGKKTHFCNIANFLQYFPGICDLDSVIFTYYLTTLLNYTEIRNETQNSNIYAKMKFLSGLTDQFELT